MLERRSRCAALAAAVLTGVAGATGVAPATARWLPLEAPAGIDRAAEALALDPSTHRIAVGGERGVALGPRGGPLERALPRGPVHDLVFEGGALLAATEVGLYRIEAPDRVSAETIAAGVSAR